MICNLSFPVFDSRVLGLVVLLGVSLSLGACQTATPEPAPIMQALPTVAVPPIPGINPKEVEWKVYNTAELEKLVAEVKQNGDKNFVIFALTPKGYQNLSYNLSELERYIKEQKQVTLFLKKTLDARSKLGQAQQ